MDNFPRTAVYPGSFDPPTKGHLDVLKRAAGLFDRVVVGIGRNPEKDSLFTAEERIGLMKTVRAFVMGAQLLWLKVPQSSPEIPPWPP